VVAMTGVAVIVVAVMIVVATDLSAMEASEPDSGRFDV
jgi:hypothetical protein